MAQLKVITGSERWQKKYNICLPNVRRGAQPTKSCRESQKLAIVAVCTDCSRQYLPW
jgi:hypothetical protein